MKSKTSLERQEKIIRDLYYQANSTRNKKATRRFYQSQLDVAIDKLNKLKKSNK